MNIHFVNEQKLPAVVESAAGGGELETLLELCRAEADSLRELRLRHGAVLLRGFRIENVADFARVVREFGAPLDYVGGASPRFKLGGGVYTSTEYANYFALSLHNELSYTAQTPDLLYFCCLQPAETGGATPLADSRKLLRRIDAEIVRRFNEKSIKYTRNLTANADDLMSWQAAFETLDKQIVEDWCRARGAKFEWQANGNLRISETRPATAVHTTTGEEVWFNQADGFHPSSLHPATYAELIALMPESEFRLNCCYGDDSPIEIDALAHVRAAIAAEIAVFEWAAGDVLIVDNRLACHGRMPFTGARRVVLAMT